MRANHKPVARHFNLPIITPTTTWQFADYLYATGTQNAAKISDKNSSLNWVHSIHTGSRNASHSTNLFTNSCHRISSNINGQAPPHSPINQQHSTIPPFALTKSECSKPCQLSKSFTVAIQTKFLLHFVYSQLVCLLPVGILNLFRSFVVVSSAEFLTHNVNYWVYQSLC